MNLIRDLRTVEQFGVPTRVQLKPGQCRLSLSLCLFLAADRMDANGSNWHRTSVGAGPLCLGRGNELEMCRTEVTQLPVGGPSTSYEKCSVAIRSAAPAGHGLG